MNEKLKALHTAITDIVNDGDAPWLEKRDRVVNYMAEDCYLLEEFIGWFDGYEFPEE